MASSLVRRPLPALVALLALLLLTLLVWWRVLHRNDNKHPVSGPSCSAQATASPSAGSLPAPNTITVKVVNGTYLLKKSRSGIASKVRAALLTDGFHVTPKADNDTKVKVRTVAEIRYGPRAADAAKLLGYYFPNARAKPQTWTTTTVTVSIGAKYTHIATKAAVQRELAAAHLSVTPSPGSPSGIPSC